MTTRPIDSPVGIVELIRNAHGCTMDDAKKAFTRAAEATTLHQREQVDVEQHRRQRIDELAQVAMPALLAWRRALDSRALTNSDYRQIADDCYDMAEAMQDESERRRRK